MTHNEAHETLWELAEYSLGQVLKSEGKELAKWAKLHTALMNAIEASIKINYPN